MLLEEGGITYMRQSGHNISFTCTADGFPLPNITWYRDGLPLQIKLDNCERFKVTQRTVHGFRKEGVRATQSVLTVIDLLKQDGRNYSCRAYNAIGLGTFLVESYQLFVDTGRW